VFPPWWFSTIEATTTKSPQASSGAATSPGGVAAAVIVCLLLLFAMIALAVYFRKHWSESDEEKQKGDDMVFNYVNQPPSDAAYLAPMSVGTRAKGVTVGKTLATDDDNQYEAPVAMNPRYASIPNNRVTTTAFNKYTNNHNNHNNTNNIATTTVSKDLRLKGRSVVEDEEETFEEDGFYDNLDDGYQAPKLMSRTHSIEIEKNTEYEYEAALQPQYAVPSCI
jgi:hypothetical protein